ncbi:hypothetical protein WN48_06817 [Eufriesea mexicana]|nr:hypothetical protein WN48_06817 [Eufriesea mexicana]
MSHLCIHARKKPLWNLINATCHMIVMRLVQKQSVTFFFSSFSKEFTVQNMFTVIARAAEREA